MLFFTDGRLKKQWVQPSCVGELQEKASKASFHPFSHFRLGLGGGGMRGGAPWITRGSSAVKSWPGFDFRQNPNPASLLQKPLTTHFEFFQLGCVSHIISYCQGLMHQRGAGNPCCRLTTLLPQCYEQRGQVPLVRVPAWLCMALPFLLLITNKSTIQQLKQLRKREQRGFFTQTQFRVIDHQKPKTKHVV